MLKEEILETARHALLVMQANRTQSCSNERHAALLLEYPSMGSST
ncbi:MAG: hypothetical protein VKL39_00015 [Leptolyngbyaceae bacterium]|nr:hypothetical protein [Leptolyngbyaceae bacterium]